MTWQEELRKLDSALAEGELAANEYRKRRDEILAAASSAQPPSPVIGPPTGPRPVIAPPAPDGDNAEVTQIVNVDAAEAEQTQIIDATTAAGAVDETTKDVNAEPERTQVVTTEAPPAQQQPQNAPQPGAPQQPVWAAQLPDPNAATGSFPRPPQPMAGPAVTPMDAQDLFTSNKPPRDGGKKPLMIGLVALVVLALVGGAVWFFAFRDDGADPGNTAGGGDTQQEQPTTTTTKAEEEQPPPVEPVDISQIELPGEPVSTSGEMDIQRAGELNVIAPAEATLLAGAGADQLVYNGTSDGDFHYLLYSYQSKDAKAAAELTKGIVDVQKQLGFKPTKVDGVPASVDVSTVTNAEAAGIRGVYTYGDTTIEMFVLQIPAGDANEMRVQFQRVMQSVTDAAPPAE